MPTAHQVQKALESLMKGRTVIAIAHRLSTIMNANLIMALRLAFVHCCAVFRFCTLASRVYRVCCTCLRADSRGYGIRQDHRAGHTCGALAEGVECSSSGVLNRI